MNSSDTTFEGVPCQKVKSLAKKEEKEHEVEEKKTKKYRPFHPTGVFIVMILVILYGVIANVSAAIEISSDLPIISIYYLIFTFLFLIILYGLWGMKYWTPRLVQIVYTLNIIGSFVIIFIIPTLMYDTVVAEIGELANNYTRDQILTVIAGAYGLVSTFFLNFFLGLGVMYYITDLDRFDY
ncbi:MAG: hypothetical protein ACTSW1_05035 [Candidatus Hodarchaeales archaeon]